MAAWGFSVPDDPATRLTGASRLFVAVLGLAACALPLGAQEAEPSPDASRPQTQADDYTRYELQDPGSHGFRNLYDVTATTEGAAYYFNSIRAGAEEEVHGVTDLHSGEPLEWTVVTGEEARTQGHPRAGLEGRYIRVTLARPVPPNGEARIRIDKTYVDPESYYVDGEDVVFERSLGIKRNAVVLPRGFELVAVNHPSQVALEADGRIRVSFMNAGPAAVPYVVRARPLPPGSPPPGPINTQAALPGYEPETAIGPRTPLGVRLDHEVLQRANQDREIVYYLQDPETHSFRLYHDYTESRPGVNRYLNVVRTGSSASDPQAYLLDTGSPLEVEQLRGMEITERGLEIGSVITPETEVVVIWFDPPGPGETRRLRIWETYTDPDRYMLAGEELVWDRAFGRPRNAVVLPAGWYLTHSDIPGRVSLEEDGRVRIDFWNDRQGNIQVFLKARRR
jgi:hypothetical protein